MADQQRELSAEQDLPPSLFQNFEPFPEILEQSENTKTCCSKGYPSASVGKRSNIFKSNLTTPKKQRQSNKRSMKAAMGHCGLETKKAKHPEEITSFENHLYSADFLIQLERLLHLQDQRRSLERQAQVDQGKAVGHPFNPFNLNNLELTRNLQNSPTNSYAYSPYDCIPPINMFSPRPQNSIYNNFLSMSTAARAMSFECRLTMSPVLLGLPSSSSSARSKSE